MDKHKLILPISILLGCIIIGSFYYVSQVNKQQSIERQQAIKLQEEKKAEEIKAERDRADNYFKKKIECDRYTDEIKREVAETNSFNLSMFSENFEMLFYSPKDNSCLYVIERYNKNKSEYFIYNALTKSKITSFQFPAQWEDYKKFILEYSDEEIRL